MIRASLVQMNAVPLGPAANFDKIFGLLATEAAAGADLVVFPELANTGYIEPLAPGGPFVSEVPDYGAALVAACADLDGPEIARVAGICREHAVTAILGLGLRDPVNPGVIRNVALLVTPEGVAGHYAKVHQWHNEKLYFTPGRRIVPFDALDTRLGMQICYDIRFPEITRLLAVKGASIIASIWASFGPEGAPVADEDLFVHRCYTRAIENGVFVLSCNRAGRHGTARFFGRSCAVAPDGRVLGRLDHDGEDVLRVEIDLGEVIRYRAATGIWADRAPEVYANALKDIE
jgi:predicted amidohydrolase